MNITEKSIPAVSDEEILKFPRVHINIYDYYDRIYGEQSLAEYTETAPEMDTLWWRREKQASDAASTRRVLSAEETENQSVLVVPM